MDASQSLILLPSADLIGAFGNQKAALIQPKAVVRRDALIACSKAIERVAGPTSQQAAVNVLGELSKMLKQAETERKLVKDPFLTFTRRIDADAKTFSEPLELEQSRLKRGLGAFQMEQERIAREARWKQEAELARLAEERRVAELTLQTAQTAQEAAKAEEKILATDMKAATAVMTPIAAPVKAEGMAVRPRWKVTVINAAALYKVFPDLVELKPRLREINANVARAAEDLPEDTSPTLPGCIIERDYSVSARQ